VIDDVAPRLAALDEQRAQSARGEGKWSVKQIVGHLVDSAANNHRRFVLAQGRDDLLFEGYDQEHWVATQRYASESWSDLVSLWLAYNRHLVWVIEGISENELAKPRVVHRLDRIAWKVQRAEDPVTLAFLINDYVDHLENHLRQVFPEAD
jgi:uncharacterized damage-inducible protein DinB